MPPRTLVVRINVLLIALATCACDGAPRGRAMDAPPALDATLVVTGGGLTLAAGPVVVWNTADVPDYEVFPAQPQQTLVGFGGAFNEKGWEALGLLPAATREEVLHNIFAPGAGLNLTLCRIPIGANDYALTRYTLDDGAPDLTMERFSIEHDRQLLIPYIHAAQAANPTLRFWSSPWTPPPWMKTNNLYDSGAMRDEPAIYAAYALYLARFIEEYGKEGIAIDAVAVQNEPHIQNDYPSCLWQPAQFQVFVRDHLGPTLLQRAVPTTVLLGTFNDPADVAQAMAVLQDPAARVFVGPLGVQWFGLPITRAARTVAPGLALWHTETDCGNHPWEGGFNPDRPPNDWAYALSTWRNVRSYLAGGVALYSLWNLVLDDAGKSTDAKVPWPQNAPVVVDRGTLKVSYTPMYYAFAHFSRYAVPGSVLLDGQGSGDAIAFRRPDGTLAVVLANPAAYPQGLRVKVGDNGYYAELPAHGFGTLLIQR